MLCSLYRTDLPALVSALTDADLLVRYQDQLADEVKSCAERRLLAHLKRMSTLASQLQAEGLDQLARRDAAATDTLLTDLFAVATWHDWELPVQSLGDQMIEVEDLPRGFLAAERHCDGAHLWQLDATTIALSRARESGDELIDDRKHHGGGACQH